MLHSDSLILKLNVKTQPQPTPTQTGIRVFRRRFRKKRSASVSSIRKFQGQIQKYYFLPKIGEYHILTPVSLNVSILRAK